MRDDVHEVRAEARSYAPELRAAALAVDADPGRMTEHLENAGVRAVTAVMLPPSHRPAGATTPLGRAASCELRAAAVLEFARADAGTVMSAPGPSLAGLAVELLGSDDQKDDFYGAVVGSRWACFAMTEPRHGSDATRIATTLTRTDDGWRLDGSKKYIGNGARSHVGVVFARSGPSPMSIRAAVVRLAHHDGRGVDRAPLDMTGLRGARISELTFTGVPVHAGDVLGRHLPASRQGLWGAVRTFTYMRVQVAALAAGTAAAVVEAAGRAGVAVTGSVPARVAAVDQLVLDAARQVDSGADATRAASVAKLQATRLVRECVAAAKRSLGPGRFVSDPFLEKWDRDSRAFDLMEGTANMQRLHIADHYVRSVGARG